jgi:hypothetical protein
MVLADGTLVDAEQKVLRILAEAETDYDAAVLISQLRTDGYTDEIARAAIWYLIDRMKIELTPSLDLALPSLSANAADDR